MNCSDYQEQSFRQDEMTAAERADAESHLQHCKSCQKDQAELLLLQKGIALSRSRPATPRAPGALSDRIMREVRQPARVARYPIFQLITDHLFTRYALGVASVALVVMFAMEFQQPALPHHDTALTVGTANASFPQLTPRASVQRERNSLLSLFDCAREINCSNVWVKKYRQRFPNQ